MLSISDIDLVLVMLFVEMIMKTELCSVVSVIVVDIFRHFLRLASLVLDDVTSTLRSLVSLLGRCLCYT